MDFGNYIRLCLIHTNIGREAFRLDYSIATKIGFDFTVSRFLTRLIITTAKTTVGNNFGGLACTRYHRATETATRP